MNLNRLISQLVLTALAAAAPALSTATTHASFRSGASFYGQPAPSAMADRVVDVANIRCISVAYGETVTFTDGGQRFTWSFNGLDSRRVDLVDIAPPGFGRSLKVYVAQNPWSNN